MPGAIVMIIVLCLFPMLAAMGGAAIAAVLGVVLDKDASTRNEGSELLDLNV